ncbi:nucleotidyl transferase AbiEii/AbiGii toxin family protein [Vreelandella rituensis]|uniref:Nucleotidyl transferase AbiEii/AbiGii toxin family protein n=1 Tax=Vreelandella rituensis TaxID=2282306 RepID=A0A368TTW1_9GAMM|nr:nucleotidyl transferase AbiEii/AbiGii toxin family protein [Halomonas rituensis]RCV88134.1 nucleotidyl transferase AbiEii/AbiGii toxin family protein [Halomonas rituensis]
MVKIEPADFDTLVAMAMEDPARQAMRPVIEKELFHFDILFALDREGLLDKLTFQGGTCLRLCQGSPRFSEDLDFAGGWAFQSDDVTLIKTCIQDYISHRYRLDVTVKTPKELKRDPRYAEVRVDKWQVAVVTSPARPDIPKQRIKLEIASLPAYTREPYGIHIHYPFLPEGYSDLLVMAETADEIMADKLVSLVNTQKYVRYRDIWDLQWLKQQGAVPNQDLLQRKISDYSVECYTDKARDMVSRLPGLISGRAFHNEMTRFLPADTLARTLDRPRFTDFLTRELTTMFNNVVVALDDTKPSQPPPEFTL